MGGHIDTLILSPGGKQKWTLEMSIKGFNLTKGNVMATITKTKNLVNKINALQAEVAPILAEIDQAKAELLEQMQTDGVDKVQGTGVYALKIDRKNYKVVSDLAVRAWMREKRLTIANFMRFDPTKVREAGEFLNEVVPGTEVSVTPYITLKPSGLTKLTKVVK
jgi:hypothetical protein